jgi:7-carboxy-7-deazaguanine synthase
MSGSEPTSTIRITEVFYSLQGESRSVGLPTVFVRLTGCPLRCTYCDTEYAFTGGSAWGLEEILDEVAGYQCRHVCVTGGEPLAQKGCRDLLTALCDAGYEVSLETSGALDITGLDPRVSVVMDLKTPSSGEMDRNRIENLGQLRAEDQLKFVIGDRADYEWAKTILEQETLAAGCERLFSPCFGRLQPRELAEWILQDRLAVRFQLQLHKVLWGDAPGR